MHRVILCFLMAGISAFADMTAGDKAYARQDFATALKEYLPLARQGNVEAQFRVGYIYTQGRTADLKQAVEWFQQAAKGGHPNAEFNLGQMYAFGQGVTRNPAEAVKWYKLAAQHGWADAQLRLGIAYEEGFGVAKNDNEAVKLYHLAATNPQPGQGRSLAEFSVAVMYHEGRGVDKNWKEAAKWFEIAAEHGYPEAQFDIGWMYYVPEGVEEDFVKAYAWIKISQRTAASSETVMKNPEESVMGKAREISEELKKKMTPQQLAAAEKLINSWKPKS